MNPFEKFHSLPDSKKECISFIDFSSNSISLSPSENKLIIDHSTEALDLDQYNQFVGHMESMGFKDDEWILLHCNLLTTYKNTRKLDNHYYRLVRFVKKMNEELCKRISVEELKDLYFPFSDKLIDELKKSKREKKYLCYNGSARIHRILLVDDLVKKDLIRDGMISMHEKPNEEFFNMIENEQYAYLNKKVDRENYFFESSPHYLSNIDFGGTIDGIDADFWCTIDRQHLMNTYFNLIPETIFFMDEPDDYLLVTEKTYKSIIQHPSLIFGRPHTLRHLKDIGFKTFDNMFDESYDDEMDDLKRYNMVLNEIERLCKCSHEDLQMMYNDSIDIFLHNQQVMLNETKTFLDVKGELIDEY